MAERKRNLQSMMKRSKGDWGTLSIKPNLSFEAGFSLRMSGRTSASQPCSTCCPCRVQASGSFFPSHEPMFASQKTDPNVWNTSGCCYINNWGYKSRRTLDFKSVQWDLSSCARLTPNVHICPHGQSNWPSIIP